MFSKSLNDEPFHVKQSRILKANVSNADEVLMSEEEHSFNDDVRKGVIEVISLDDIKATYGNQFFKGEDIATIENKIDLLIKKGEEEYLTEDEFNQIEKAKADIKLLERKAVAIVKGDTTTYKEVFVTPVTESEEED